MKKSNNEFDIKIIDELFTILVDNPLQKSSRLNEFKKIHGDDKVMKILNEIRNFCDIKQSCHTDTLIKIKYEVLSKMVQEERNLKLNNLLNNG